MKTGEKISWFRKHGSTGTDNPVPAGLSFYTQEVLVMDIYEEGNVIYGAFNTFQKEEKYIGDTKNALWENWWRTGIRISIM